ncbi:hypothetical protein [Naasia aerilata]|uniref:Uncharacterized protein n=1 Tax=Naasia aerilata TaxID=1162966 RepID=A0ABN6XNZ8_9MICO|nr:hypothetical protein [Naasia aerilata]BDZ45350.1 hypothetical protein GCM10025866_12590 [Naasia aerilata]
MLPPAGPEEGRALASAAAELRALAEAVDALTEVEWRSPAALAYARAVRDIASDVRDLAALLEAEARSFP